MQAPFVWAGKSSLRRDVFAELEPSLHHGRFGARRTSRDDYADRLTSRGLLQGPAELPSRPALVAEVQAHWHSTATSGCLFEAYLSSKREHYGWVTVVPVDDEGPAAMAE
jgi:hypothetical protein